MSITWKEQTDPHRIMGWSVFARFYIGPDYSQSTRESVLYSAQICDGQYGVLKERDGFATIYAAQHWCMRAYRSLLRAEWEALNDSVQALFAEHVTPMRREHHEQ